jgi:formate hydrogenlyase subunit 3/multisubunit Na+/H+ antiporter MnhD subunit
MMPKITKLLPLLAILVPMVVHFVLVCFVLLAGWLPGTFFFSHFFLFLTGAWTVHHRDTLLPIIMYIVVVAITVLMDIIQLGLFFEDNQDDFGGGETQEARTWQFSAGMMILSLLLKPLTIALAVVAAYLKSGAPLPFLGTGRRDAYDGVDQHHSPPT